MLVINGVFKMNVKLAIFVVLVVSVFLVGCSPKTQYNGYAAYNQPQGQQPQGGQYVGGGCGVAPNAPYENTPVNALNPANSA